MNEKLQDKKIVIPKETSRLYQYTKNLQKKVNEIKSSVMKIKGFRRNGVNGTNSAKINLPKNSASEGNKTMKNNEVKAKHDNRKSETTYNDNKVNNKNSISGVKKSDNIFIKPVEGKITSDFGYRAKPVDGATSNHSGIDIGIPVGTPIKAIADGTVVAANGGMRGYGNGIFIDHGFINGKHVISEYGHLSSFEVKIGDKINAGQVIAKSGNTGISSGPHLHITIRENNIPVDPKKYLDYFNN